MYTCCSHRPHAAHPLSFPPSLSPQRAHRYAEVTGLAGTMTPEEVTKALSPIIGNRTVNFIADGVVYKKDRNKGERGATLGLRLSVLGLEVPILL